MKIHLPLVALFSLCLAGRVLPATSAPENRGAGFDALGHFTVQSEIPAGSRHAVLEITSDLSASASWRPMIATAIDGREAKLMFRLPPQASGKVFARVKTGISTTLPTVELSGPDLCYVTYADSISSGAKIAFLTSASTKMGEWSALPLAQWQANLIAWALQDPKVASAEVVPPADNVSVRFKDGTTATLMRAPRRYTGPAMQSAATAVAKAPHSPEPFPPAPAPPKIPTETGRNLPDSNNAVTAFSLETGFPNSAPTIGSWLATRSYAVRTFPSTTIDQILQWSASKPMAALFWQSHGVPYRKKDGSIGIALVTRQYATDALSDGPYAAMIKNDEINFAVDDEKKPFYAVTSEFVRKRMRFSPNSIVVVDACYGGGAELAAGFTAAGAGSYASWDWLSGPYSGTPCLKVFDRLLGMNQEPPVSVPKERAFSLMATRWWMSAYQFDYDPSPEYPNQGRPNAKLTWYDHPDKPGHILCPTIMRVLHENKDLKEPYTKFLIEGDFGDDPGESLREVLWGGQKMQVVRWEPYYGIAIRMPSSPPRGNIEVIMRKGGFTRRSNVVPITEWTVPFTYEVSGKGSLNAKMVMNVKFRADIRGSRGNPEMPVQYLGRLFSNMADCEGTVSASGTHSPDAATTFTWSGGSSLTSVDPNADETYAPKRIRNSGSINFGVGRIDQFQLSGDGDFTETEVRVHNDGSSTTIVRQLGIGFPGFYPAPEMPLNLGNGTLRGNTLEWSGSEGTVKLSWPSVTPQMMPDNNTPR
ncbi:hypothetical protein OJ996_04225 [Luteolibacter sp. GHJ8]|uniref:Uncharacterized protein n=1 Tax=Luteolibacter rhizosphaerae TaxID=2989719 RepID=A0ABT3FYV9_9BACT|nr:hypothetical protein [Luteolibacter rhizosphaerae]MCW1912765.1 hypothetical protein [Luteolibacter rhizosphaerae]